METSCGTVGKIVAREKCNTACPELTSLGYCNKGTFAQGDTNRAFCCVEQWWQIYED